VTLRSEIHTAIDDIAPPAPALPREAVAFVFSNGRLRSRETLRSRSGWELGMRRAGSLVAAALIGALMITLVIGGRVWRDWNTQQQNAARQAYIVQLHDRPLHLPAVAPGAVCPQDTINNYHGYYGGYGIGPVVASGGGQRYGLASGTYIDTGYWTAPEVSGLVLIRGRNLETNEPIVFAQPPYPAVGTGTPWGSVASTEVILGVRVKFHEELLLDKSKLMPAPDDWWETIQRFPPGSSGCVGIQADGFNSDGSSFSEVIVLSFLMIT
jgi:hypothetical protein